MFKLIKVLTVVFFTVVTTMSATAQEQGEVADSLGIMAWLTRNFSFDVPDTGFVALAEGNGYRNANLGAGIKFLTFPRNYSKSKAEFLERKSTEESRLIEIAYHQVNNQEAFSRISEEMSPDQTQYENHIMIMTLIGFGDVTACVVGSYPKSKDALLRKKFIQASLTLKEIK